MKSYLEASKYTGVPCAASTTRCSDSKELRMAASSFFALFVSLRNCLTDDSIASILLFISVIAEEASLSLLPNSPMLFSPSNTCGIRLLEVSCSFSAWECIVLGKCRDGENLSCDSPESSFSGPSRWPRSGS